MSLHTPRRLGPARPSLHPTASSPNLSLASSKNIARQASLSALVGGASSPSNRMGADGQNIGVGDTVDVPGGMHGVVQFVGAIRGKAGVFAGVELSRAYAPRGKNNGEVDGYASWPQLEPAHLLTLVAAHITSTPRSQARASSSPYTAPKNDLLQIRPTSPLRHLRLRTAATSAFLP